MIRQRGRWRHGRGCSLYSMYSRSDSVNAVLYCSRVFSGSAHSDRPPMCSYGSLLICQPTLTYFLIHYPYSASSSTFLQKNGLGLGCLVMFVVMLQYPQIGTIVPFLSLLPTYVLHMYLYLYLYFYLYLYLYLFLYSIPLSMHIFILCPALSTYCILSLV